MLYAYKKATPDDPYPGRRIPPYLKALPTLMSAVGLGLVASVVFPMVSFFLPKFTQIFEIFDPGLLSPAAYESLADEPAGPVILGGADYTRASTWFPGSLSSDFYGGKKDEYIEGLTSTYTLSIPALGIYNAEVALKDEDLERHLVQYPQTALPGDLGSPVIFGHSTLPQFFNPEKYTTIFSHLPKIKEGEKILVSFRGTEYAYQITKKFEVNPTDLWVLRQEYSARTIKLITCVPPGTTLKRLIVEAKLLPKE